MINNPNVSGTFNSGSFLAVMPILSEQAAFVPPCCLHIKRRHLCLEPHDLLTERKEEWQHQAMAF